MTLMPIGRFAAASRLSIKALRNHDNRGLLPAACTDPATGYRYYRPDQLARADTIRRLRAIDLPLADIAEYLLSEDPAAALASGSWSSGREVLAPPVHSLRRGPPA